jgi:hypothetical protein
MSTSPVQEAEAPEPEQDQRMEQTRFAMLAAAARGDFREAAHWVHVRASLRMRAAQGGQPA